MFDNLLSIVTAPIKVADQLILKPLAEVAEDIVDGLK
jgi:hypothetical protein